jgi:hypothetical protein
MDSVVEIINMGQSKLRESQTFGTLLQLETDTHATSYPHCKSAEEHKKPSAKINYSRTFSSVSNIYRRRTATAAE